MAIIPNPPCSCSPTSVVHLLFCLLFFLLLDVDVALTAATHAKELYVAYMGDKSNLEHTRVETEHHEMLVEAIGSHVAAKESLLYHYKHSLRGFAAKLSQDEAATISRMAGVVSVFRSKDYTPQTTRSWQFLGLESENDDYHHLSSNTIWSTTQFGRDVIIGFLDTGIWPESQSFRDESLPKISKRWKGKCEEGDQFNASNCNRKLIGARSYIKAYEHKFGRLNVTDTADYLSVRDKYGHGTHISSTAAGNFVANVSTYGFGNGTAKGGAPHARIAMYKVCWPFPDPEPVFTSNSVCEEADILAAMDDGIHDGVDVFSIPLGHAGPGVLFKDSVFIGSFHAILNNIVVFASAGNYGPEPETVAYNSAPWIISVAASSIDRTFPSPVSLGDGTILKAQSISPFTLENRFFPLVFGKTAGSTENGSIYCLPNSLDPAKVKGTVVLCMRSYGLAISRIEMNNEVLNAGGIATIIGSPPSYGHDIIVDVYTLPGAAIGADDAIIAQEYIRQNVHPIISIKSGTTEVGINPAPIIPAFSSRGPNLHCPDILKPDISAPGVSILAAWTMASSPSSLFSDTRRVDYNIMSGTSVACQTAVGVGALLRSIHPTWSPAAIKSAIMTTAKVTNNLNQPITTVLDEQARPFDFGSGELNPIAALDPGLIYDTTPEDYLPFLCKVGHDDLKLMLITGLNFSCHAKKLPSISNLNYPSISLSNLKHTRILTRTVTNVGPIGTYHVMVQEPPGISVDITPKSLYFGLSGQFESFNITFSVRQSSKGQYVFGSYTWSDGAHVVRSPIVVSTI